MRAPASAAIATAMKRCERPHGRREAWTRRLEANERVTVFELHDRFAFGRRERFAFASNVCGESELATFGECGDAAVVFAFDEIERAGREARRVRLARRAIRRARMRVHEKRGTDRNERDGGSERHEKSTTHARRAIHPNEKRERFARRNGRRELERVCDRRARRDVKWKRRGRDEREVQENQCALRVRVDACGSREERRGSEHDSERNARIRDARRHCEEPQQIRRQNFFDGRIRFWRCERREHATISEREPQKHEQLACRERKRDDDRRGRHRRHDARIEQKPTRRESPKHDRARRIDEKKRADDAHDETRERIVHRLQRALRGSKTVNVEPCPISLSSSIDPPCIVARRRAMARPNPVPR